MFSLSFTTLTLAILVVLWASSAFGANADSILDTSHVSNHWVWSFTEDSIALSAAIALVFTYSVIKVTHKVVLEPSSKFIVTTFPEYIKLTQDSTQK
ncbi:hypothetical protein CJU89_2134 [Yarrowia sp. B02]|nr:hypothetical protein CJU89_2134 [Yarrowia sp. B02]